MDYQNKLRESAARAVKMGNIFDRFGYSKSGVLGSYLKNGTWRKGDLDFRNLVNFLWLEDRIPESESIDGYSDRIFVNCTIASKHLFVNNDVVFLNCLFTRTNLLFEKASTTAILYNCNLRDTNIVVDVFSSHVSIEFSQMYSSTINKKLGEVNIKLSSAEMCNFSNINFIKEQNMKKCNIKNSNVFSSTLLACKALEGNNISLSMLTNCTLNDTSVFNSVCNSVSSKDSSMNSVVWRNGRFDDGEWRGGKWISGTWNRGTIYLSVFFGDGDVVQATGKRIKKVKSDETPRGRVSEGLVTHVSPDVVIKEFKKAGFIVKQMKIGSSMYGGEIVVLVKKDDKEKFYQIMHQIKSVK